MPPFVRRSSSSGPARAPGVAVPTLLLALFPAFWLGGCGAGDEAPEPPLAVGGDATAASTPTAAPPDPFPLLDAEGLCPNSGYLCAFLLPAPGSGVASDTPGSSAATRVARWPDSTPLLRIALPTPPGLPPEQARELRQAALRGLLAWDRQPFPIQILDRADGEGPSASGVAAGGAGVIQVTWRDELAPGQAGRVVTRWEVRGPDVRFEVVSFELALSVRPTGAGGGGGGPHRLSPEELERVAAHEMGHALGLGHSENPGDLMYPTNTGRALSPRDYRTMEALYRLEPGSRITRGGDLGSGPR